jgi:hypothetical protein
MYLVCENMAPGLVRVKATDPQGRDRIVEVPICGRHADLFAFWFSEYHRLHMTDAGVLYMGTLDDLLRLAKR